MRIGEKILEKMGYDVQSVWSDLEKFKKDADDLRYNDVLDDLNLRTDTKVPYINMYACTPSSKQQIAIKSIYDSKDGFTMRKISNMVTRKRKDLDQDIKNPTSLHVEFDALRTLGMVWDTENPEYNEKGSPGYKKLRFDANKSKIKEYFPDMDKFKENYGTVCKRKNRTKNSRNDVTNCAIEVLRKNLGLGQDVNVLGVVKESDILGIAYFDLKMEGVTASKRNMSSLRKSLIKKMKDYKASQTVNMPIMSSGTSNTPK